MTDTHQHAILRPGDCLQLGRQRLGHAERVVAHGGESLGQPGEHAIAFVLHLGQVTMPRPRRAEYLRSIGETDPLVPEADPEGGEVLAAQDRA